jgi:7-carboxy-7-deazaguanine synthase
VSGCAKKSLMLATATLRVNETFHSLQGEGSLIGTPSFFIRLDGCPLRCSWCDTPYALAGDSGEALAVDELLDRSHAARHVVITGGEPLAQDIAPLVAALSGRHITVETSGTIFADLPGVSLFSISPKVGTSGYTPKTATLRKFCTSGAGRTQLKFVIGERRDYDEARACVRELADALPVRTPIILQPESGRAGRGERYAAFLRQLCEWTIAEDWQPYAVRVLPQLHYILWNGEAGR